MKQRLQLGDSRKYLYHTTDGFSEFRRHRGILASGILKAWGGVESGIYTGDRQEFIPWKLFFMDVLNQFVNRARTSDISSLTPNNTIKRFLEYKYNHLTGFWEPFYVDSPFFNCRTCWKHCSFFLRNVFCFSLRTPFSSSWDWEWLLTPMA